jgi:DMSO/TMAO reductase YedYZ molybdopterin-dependent catalytic subunit
MRAAKRCATLIVWVTAVWSLSLAPGTGRHASIAAAEAVLRVGGEGARPLTLHDADFAHLPRTVVRVHEPAGTVATYAGVLLRDILALAGVPLGEQLRGDRLALYVVVEAADGYRVVFALPDLDAAFADRVVLLADRRDEQPLPAAEGPLRLVIPVETRHARWVRQVVALSIRRAP